MVFSLSPGGLIRWTGRCLCISVLFALAACGGGGGTAPTGAMDALTGQVVKGLTSGSTVSLYLVAQNGEKTLVSTALSDVSGNFSMSSALQIGSVYLLEANGGQFVNEITGASEVLSAPMRAVFVASGAEHRFAIGVLSEAAVIQAERSGAANPWSPSAITAITSRVSASAGLSSTFDFKFVDLTRASEGKDPGVSDSDIEFSFHAGLFAGFLHELRLRDAATTLATAFSKYYAVAVAGDDDDGLQSAMAAGLVRFVEKAPLLNANKASLYYGAGLPSNTDSSVFSGAESTGRAGVAVPSWQMRYLSSGGYSSMSTTNTVFNNRGALIAYDTGSGGSLSNFVHIGYSSAAEVYGTEETAIGRWNHGYYYPRSVSYDRASNRFLNSNSAMEVMNADLPYAAAIPAHDVPICGTALMSLKASTKAFGAFDNSRQYTLDDSSKLAFYFANGSTFVGYNVVLVDNLGNHIAFSTPGGANTPWLGLKVGQNQEFRPVANLPLPSGESLQMTGLLAGNGGAKAVITIATNIHTSSSIGMAAAFAQDGALRPCQPISFSRGSVSPVPETDSYYIHLTNLGFFSPSSDFFSNGTPKFSGAQGITEDSSVEKHGNGLAGIGIIQPPFTYLQELVNVPRPYLYLKTPENSQNSVLPISGAATYHLVASTPFLLTTSNQLIMATAIQSADLVINFNQFPLGTVSPYYGTCQLTIDDQSTPALTAQYYGGTCLAAESYNGGITSDGGRYAVIKYVKYYSYDVKGEVALLFEKNP